MGGNAGVAGGAPGSNTINLDGSPIYTRMQRLTNGQWERAVADVLRFASPANLSQSFSTPASAGATDFANNEKRLFVDAQAALDFEAGSEKAAALATGSADALARLYPGTDAAGFVRTVGGRAFRRPLTTDEQAKYQDTFALGERLYGAGFANGAALVIRALLQSPTFLYRSELGPAGAPLDGYELAAKLSFGLLGTTPSDELLDAAAAGALDAVDGLERACWTSSGDDQRRRCPVRTRARCARRENWSKKNSFGRRPARRNSLTTFGSPGQLRRRAVICGSPMRNPARRRGVAHM